MSILTLTTYKAIKNITSTDKDVSISEAIKSVNSFIPSYCNRNFTDYYEVDKTEFFDGVNDAEIYPDVYPIVSVTSLKTSSDGGETYTTTLAEYTDYIIDDRTSSIISTSDCFVDVTIATNSVQLIYKGGYETVPEDLQMAGAHLVEYYLEEQYTPTKAFSGVSVDNLTITDNTAKLPAHIRRVLEHYRAINI